MTVEIRPVADTDDEVREWWRAHSQGFGQHPDWGELDDERSVCPVERMVGGFEDGRCVATAASYPFELTVSPGRCLPVAGLANVTVASTHRRRGLLRELLGVLHRGALERDEPLAALTASEGGIYGRFGYGIATSFLSWDLSTDRAELMVEPTTGGRLELAPQTEAPVPLHAAYDRIRTERPGFLGRSEAWWDLMLGTRQTWKGGGRLFVVVHRDAHDEPDGYATYRIHHEGRNWLNEGRVEVTELLGTDSEVEAELWRHLFDLDLVVALTAKMQPVDDPLRWRLSDPRQLRIRGPVDLLWIHLLDVPTALERRGYALEDRLVLEVEAPDGRSSMCHALEAGPEGGAVRTVAGEADLRLAADALASLYLGGASASRLAAAGRVVEATPGALARADAVFAPVRAPFCSTLF